MKTKIPNSKFIIQKLGRKLILAILAIIVIGIPLVYLTVLNQREAKASWMDENWRTVYA